MKLQPKLDRMREQFESTAPPEALAIMHRATDDLIASGIMDGVLKVGDPIPDFSLTDHHGTLVSASALLTTGPLVISFYRGLGDLTATRSWQLFMRLLPTSKRRVRPLSPYHRSR